MQSKYQNQIKLLQQFIHTLELENISKNNQRQVLVKQLDTLIHQNHRLSQENIKLKQDLHPNISSNINVDIHMIKTYYEQYTNRLLCDLERFKCIQQQNDMLKLLLSENQNKFSQQIQMVKQQFYHHQENLLRQQQKFRLNQIQLNQVCTKISELQILQINDSGILDLDGEFSEKAVKLKNILERINIQIRTQKQKNKNQIIELQSHNKALELDISYRKQALLQIQLKNQQINSLYLNQKNQKRIIENSYKCLQQKFQNIEEEVKMLREQMYNLCQTNQALMNKIKQYEMDLKFLKIDVQDYIIEIEQLKQERQQLNIIQKQQLSKITQQFEHKLQILQQSKAKELNHKIQSFNTQINNQKRKHQLKIKQLQAQYDALQNQCNQIKNKFNQQEYQTDNLLDSSGHSDVKIKSLENQLDLKKQEVEQLKNKILLCEKLLEKLRIQSQKSINHFKLQKQTREEKYDQEIQAIKKNMKQKYEDIIKEKQFKFEKESNFLKQLINNIKSEKSQLEQINKRNKKNMEQQLNNQAKEIQNYILSIKSLQKQKENLNKLIEQLKNQGCHSQINSERYDQEQVNSLKKQVSNLIQINYTLSNQMDNLRTQKKLIDLQIKKLKDIIEQLQQKNQILQQNNLKLNQSFQIRNKFTSQSYLKQQINSLKAELVGVNLEIQRITKENQQLTEINQINVKQKYNLLRSFKTKSPQYQYKGQVSSKENKKYVSPNYKSKSNIYSEYLSPRITVQNDKSKWVTLQKRINILKIENDAFKKSLCLNDTIL